MRPTYRRALWGTIALGFVVAAVLLWPPRAVLREAEVEAQATADVDDNGSKATRGGEERVVPDDERLDALARAHVWQQPRIPITRADLRQASQPAPFSCRFKVGSVGGTTPKFDCVKDDGEEIRVKYGNAPEIPAEAAATRLLAALGFGADSIELVEQLRCYGCPKEPFVTLKTVEATRAAPLYERLVDYDDYEDFEWVAIERRFPAPAIESPAQKGFALFELDQVDSARGGAPRAHIDALRLLVVFLAHWDNKAENQRLVCRDGEWRQGERCARPFALLQDVGATFGPRKVDLRDWEATPIWEARDTCTVSMRGLPHDGATFGTARIGEPGRTLLGGLLSQLSERQLGDLFAGARFDRARSLLDRTYPIDEWVRVFRAKVAAIQDGPPCPTR
jgi:hypothetical protein